jgi:dethiobiotin synthase
MSVFVTGTDTGIGKTVVAAILALKLDYGYWKPVQSGTAEETDSEWMRRRLGAERVHPECYVLSQPLSPHASSRIDGVTIDADRILAQVPSEPAVIEGAGGLMVPLNGKVLYLDVIEHLRIPVVITARAALGTINHTLLSLMALRSRGIEPAGVVMVGEPNPSNREAIEFYGKTAVLAEVPWLNELTREALLREAAKVNTESLK